MAQSNSNERKCQWCGGPLTKHTQVKFCSNRCSLASFHSSLTPERRMEMVVNAHAAWRNASAAQRQACAERQRIRMLSLSDEDRKALAAKAAAGVSIEKRREKAARMRAIKAAQPAEQVSANARRATKAYMDSLTPEERLATTSAARAVIKAMTPAQRSALLAKVSAAVSPESRLANLAKAMAAKREQQTAVSRKISQTARANRKLRAMRIISQPIEVSNE